MNSSWQGSRDSERGKAHFMVDGMDTVTIEMGSFSEYNNVCRLIEHEVVNRIAKHADEIERLANNLRRGDWL